MTNKEKIERQCVALCELLKRKNHDYGDSFAEPPYLAPNLNVATAAFVRLSDKFKRLQTLVARNAECRDETLQDTLRDVAGRIREAEDKVLNRATNWEPEAVSPCFDLDKICE